MADDGDALQHDKSLNKFALGCAVVASIISIIFGYDTGVMSGALMFIKEDLKITDTQEEILAGILNFCALIGSLLAGRTSDYIGRRYTIVLASSIFLLGSIFMGYAPNYGVLMVGRCTAGIGVGFALMIAPVYSAEISSASHRGMLTSLAELCISIGILLGYVSNYLFGKLELQLGWRLMLGVAAVPSLALALGILKMPESPRWLVMKGRLGEARMVLLQVSNSEAEAESRFQDIKLAASCDVDDTCIKSPKASNTAGGEMALWKEMFLRPTPAVRWVLLAAIGIHFFEHAVGIEAVILYGPRILKKAGILDKNKLLLANVGIGLTKTIFILFSTTFLLDRVGRRPLLLTSTAGAATALATIGVGLTVAGSSAKPVRWALTLSIVATYAYVAVFSAGIAPLTWVYSSEIWPLRLRAIGAGIGVGVNRLMNATVSMTFISIYKAITIGGAFFMFAGIAMLAWVFFFLFLPETKGKSLEEIELIFQRRTSSTGAAAEMELQQHSIDQIIVLEASSHLVGILGVRILVFQNR